MWSCVDAESKPVNDTAKTAKVGTIGGRHSVFSLLCQLGVGFGFGREKQNKNTAPKNKKIQKNKEKQTNSKKQKKYTHKLDKPFNTTKGKTN